MCDEYNGWTNRQSWLVSLWLNNSESDYNHWFNRAKELEETASEIPQVERGVWTENQAVAFTLAHEIEEAVKDHGHDELGLYTDLLNDTLSMVDWQEVARSFIES